VPAKGARLDVTVETRDAAHAEEILAAFKAEGFAPVRIATGDAMEARLQLVISSSCPYRFRRAKRTASKKLFPHQ
jgi:hypothetical protein